MTEQELLATAYYFIHWFKDFHVDHAVGEELSGALMVLKTEIEAVE